MRKATVLQFLLKDLLGLFTVSIVLFVVLESSELLEVLQGDISHASHRFWSIGCRHSLEVCEKGLVHRNKLVKVPEERYGFVSWYYGGFLAFGECSEGIRIFDLECVQTSNVRSFSCDKFVYDVLKRIRDGIGPFT